MTWIIGASVIYLIVATFVLVLILAETKRNGETAGLAHYLVPLLWVFWGIWYLFDILLEKIKRK